MIRNFFTKQNLKYWSIGLISYSALLIPIQLFFSENELSLAFLAVVLGIVGGPAAAVGVACASFLGQLHSGVLYMAITTGITHFFQAYIPYKLWYTCWADHSVESFVYDGKSVVKFAYIAVLNALVTNSLLVMIDESVRIAASSHMFLFMVVKDTDTVLLLGLPLLTLLSNGKVRPNSPELAAKPGKTVHYDLLVYGVALAGLVYTLYVKQNFGVVAPHIAFLGWVAMFLLLAVFIQKPIFYEKAAEPDHSPTASIYAAIVWGFAFIGLIFIAFSVAIAYSISPNHTPFETWVNWQYFSEVVVWALHGLFAIALLFLWQAEKKVIRPLRQARQGQACVPAPPTAGVAAVAAQKVDVHEI